MRNKSEQRFVDYIKENEYTEKYRMPYNKYAEYFSNLSRYQNYLEEDADLRHLSEDISKAIDILSIVMIKENEIIYSKKYQGDLIKILNYFENFSNTIGNESSTEYDEEFNYRLEKLKHQVLEKHGNTKEI